MNSKGAMSFKGWWFNVIYENNSGKCFYDATFTIIPYSKGKIWIIFWKKGAINLFPPGEINIILFYWIYHLQK